MALGSTQLLTEMSTRDISWGVKAAGAGAGKRTAVICRLSRNLEASTSRNPLDLSRPVEGDAVTDATQQHCSETLLHNSERCEVLTGYLSLGRRSGGDRAIT